MPRPPPHPRAWARALRRRLVRAALAVAPRAVLALGRLGPEELGLLGEELAARALAGSGWRVLGRRIATPAGEVDVVARRADLLVAVEVKTGRMGDPGSPWRPALRLDGTRLASQRHAARWLAACLGAARSRVDLVEVRVLGRRAQVLHLADLQGPIEPPPRPADAPWLPGAPGAGPPGSGGAARRL